MARATTFDLRMANLSAGYQRYQQEQAEHGRLNPGMRSAELTPDLSIQEMQAMIARVQEK